MSAARYPDGSNNLLDQLRALPSTSARIRALDAQGMRKGDIVKYLNAHFKEPGRPHDFRYQHVHNVLAQKPPSTTSDAEQAELRPVELPERLDLQVDSAGRIVIPAVFRNAMGATEGGRLMARVVDGELRVITPKMAVWRAQKMVRELIPEDADLVGDLLEMRRKEVEDEFRDG